ncbi:MAG: PadR family transcriptional regulator [Pseudonocardiaceae bacterium]
MSADEGGSLKHSTYYRPTILILLEQHDSYGYELSRRIIELGFDQRLASNLYNVLRDMENEELITSAWDMSERGGTPRRMYAPTALGKQYLVDSVPLLIRQYQALGATLALYSTLDARN